MMLFLQTYYLLLFYILYMMSYRFINFIPSLEPEYIFFAKPLAFLNLSVEIHSVFFLIALFFCLLCVFRQDRVLRVLTLFFVLILFSIYYSYGKIGHNNHAWILSSILLCFFDSKQSLNSKYNFFFLRLTQGILLSHYFISGLWKLRNMYSSGFSFSFTEIATEYIAQVSLKHEMHFILKLLLYEIPLFLGFSYFCVLFFQLTALTPIFLNRYFKFYGVLAVLFHLSTGISLITYFSQTVLAVLFFLIFSESLREKLE